nr:MAG TPA: hypothetical protein [Caudoviricetes sp.]
MEARFTAPTNRGFPQGYPQEGTVKKCHKKVSQSVTGGRKSVTGAWIATQALEHVFYQLALRL